MSNNELPRLHELLDRATGPEGEGLNPSEGEAASLRSAWLGLCRLIQEEERAKQVVQCNDVEPIHGLDRRSLNNSPARPAAWTLWLIAAVAASVLLAVSMTTIVKRFGGRQVVPDDGKQVAQNERSGDGAVLTTSKAKNSSDQQRALGDRLQWGESVDDEITAVSRATLLAQEDWYAQSSRIGAVQSGIYDLETEMEQGKP
jgi:hypothetical protein